MRLIISPAKKLDESLTASDLPVTQPIFLKQAEQLVKVLRTKDTLAIAELMHLSIKLADLNMHRFQAWHTPFSADNAKPAIYTFAGDVYQGLDAANLSEADTTFAQQHLRILSGLYGLLKPLDLMQPYRLEMGTRLATPQGNNLYAFWGTQISQALNAELDGKPLINLASSEYFKSIQRQGVQSPIITPIFKEKKNGHAKVVGIFAKKARGLMARFIVQHQLTDVEDIKGFDAEGYAYTPALSDATQWVFCRTQR